MTTQGAKLTSRSTKVRIEDRSAACSSVGLNNSADIDVEEDEEEEEENGR